ncbi:N-acetyl-gamma-glutamyl-phosphate reductase [Pedomonas mirosovicensis]|uniref:N-acetyl-gamma-glutamyl-phosphate reductase n=1 Tax=Pedomonas mirosovicensis TaxID=2908641 RepID=UPI00216A253C|nr:N-acetyl-gamma-glutamyl-phosphate reductase [Pedomonas mirosovicensis]MCH8685933.1 N-acetyl-gamma-glutamyl-phosphate reductase [Pedomonas mirosovicensis]
MTKLKIAVLGASGYTGADLIRLALTHPQMEIVALSGERKAGQAVDAVWPHFKAYALPDLVTAESIDFSAVDAVFGCLPHATSQQIIKQIFDGANPPKVIDLSADFRLRDPATYEQWYGNPHAALELQQEAVYGLTEHARETLKGARLAACPGCYPTAALLALLPLLSGRLIAPRNITINALSGVSGAGRSLKETNLFAEVAEAMHPYGLGHHRHMPEIEQELGKAAGEELYISFTPHLVPINRGELETITVELSDGQSADSLREALAARYADEPFVHVLPKGVAPATRMVRGSNHCVINVFPDRIPGRAIVVSAIDNLVKGSSGQAIQNFNVMFGLPETMGLEQAPLFP